MYLSLVIYTKAKHYCCSIIVSGLLFLSEQVPVQGHGQGHNPWHHVAYKILAIQTFSKEIQKCIIAH